MTGTLKTLYKVRTYTDIVTISEEDHEKLMASDKAVQVDILKEDVRTHDWYRVRTGLLNPKLVRHTECIGRRVTE